ncbi:Rho GTPase [Pichia californica]|uniref:Rho GTPase n=1 Tax=Pichia californica TaxID=460514 RepID=A0A9P6WMJ0_9ASCO|nr:Rho GTPase [[Candida] californica]KAG0689817.1 Rho GTPase [[Candida] californica]
MSRYSYITPIASGSDYEVLNNDSHAHPTLQFKVVIVGDSGCGKTSLFSSYIRGSFPSSYEPTIFENHRTIVENIKTHEILSADLWDTAGQEEYERLRRLSYQDSNVVIIAYSVDAPESLLNIHEVWAPEVMTYAPHASILLVGLKSDIPNPQVNPANAYNVAQSIGAVAHLTCSSIQMFNVNELFDSVFNTAYNKETMKKHHESLSNINKNDAYISNNNNITSSSKKNNNINNKNNSSNSNEQSKSKSSDKPSKRFSKKGKSSKCTIL